MDYWELFLDTGAPEAYLLYRGPRRLYAKWKDRDRRRGAAGHRHKGDRSDIDGADGGWGKIPLIARGARRKNSRLAAACQMPAYSELTIFKRGSWYMLDEASPIELFDGLGRDIELLALAAWFCELTEAVCAEETPCPGDTVAAAERPVRPVPHGEGPAAGEGGVPVPTDGALGL